MTTLETIAAEILTNLNTQLHVILSKQQYVRSHLGVSSHQRERVVNVIVVSMRHQKPVRLVDTLRNGIRALHTRFQRESPTFSCWK